MPYYQVITLAGTPVSGVLSKKDAEKLKEKLNSSDYPDKVITRDIRK